MKKAYKVTWISLASLVGVILIVLLIAVYLVFTPKRLAGLVNKYAADYITCDYNIGKVDLTLFKTFPDVGVEISDVVLINPTKGWTTDTLAYIKECIVSVNLRKILKEDEIIVNTCLINDGFINAFFDLEGNTNLDILPPSEPKEPSVEESSYLIDLKKVKINNLRVDYTDLGSSTIATIKGLGLSLKGNIKEEMNFDDIKLNIKELTAKIDDSIKMQAGVKDISIDGKVNMKGSDIKADAAVGTGKLAFTMKSDDQNIGANLNSFNVSYKGDVNNYNLIKGLIAMSVNGVTMAMDEEKYLDNASISLRSPLSLGIGDDLSANFDKSEFKFNDIIIDFAGDFAMSDPDITMDMAVNTNTLVISELIGLIPESMREELLAGINADGKIMLNTHINGVYNENRMPLVSANVVLKDGFVQMDSVLPYPITRLNTTLHTNLDLNGKSDVSINSLSLKMNKTILAASGTIKDVLDKMLCNLSIKAYLNFDDVKSFIPEDILAEGVVKADINMKGYLEQFTELDLMNTKLDGNLQCNNLNINYFDTINIKSSDLKIDFVLPNPSKNSLRSGLAQVKLKGRDLNADITGMMTAMLDNFNIDAQVSNVLDENEPMAVMADFGFNKVDFEMEDMVLHTNFGSGSAFMLPSANDGNISYAAVYNSDSLVFGMGDDIYFATDALAVDLSADYDEKEEDFIWQWKPSISLDLSNALFNMSDLGESVIIPDISLTYGEQGLHIENSQIKLGNSDFELNGDLTNLYEHFNNDELLIGEFNFTSSYTDIDQLMRIFNGMGADEETANAANDTVLVEDKPFMVPYGVEIVMHTNIQKALTGETEIRNVGGDLTIKDGILVLQEMGFTSDAAKMQLTALYKSKRKNHLYVGLDFHLLDIDIAEMIKMIPDLDTIVPMLKSFAGKAEFHFAAETNMKSDYSLKYSTLKGACSIEGKDLVVLDSETFDMIKRKLLFSKKTNNKIDTLDVQFTVFKNEIDVYPFAVSMDKYSAMLYGRHNLDMSYDYNIAVLSPPILSRLGVEVKGPDFDNMKFKVRRSRHRNLFKPEKRDYKEEKIAEIKKIISNSLKDNVKPQ